MCVRACVHACMCAACVHVASQTWYTWCCMCACGIADMVHCGMGIVHTWYMCKLPCACFGVKHVVVLSVHACCTCVVTFALTCVRGRVQEFWQEYTIDLQDQLDLHNFLMVVARARARARACARAHTHTSVPVRAHAVRAWARVPGLCPPWVVYFLSTIIYSGCHCRWPGSDNRRHSAVIKPSLLPFFFSIVSSYLTRLNLVTRVGWFRDSKAELVVTSLKSMPLSMPMHTSTYVSVCTSVNTAMSLARPDPNGGGQDRARRYSPGQARRACVLECVRVRARARACDIADMVLGM